MDTEHFRHILKTEFGYKSPQKRYFLAENLPGWATALFYTRFVRLVYTTSRIAGSGGLNHKKWADASLAVLKIIESVGGKLQVSGLKGVAEHKGPLIYIVNHMSMIDTLIMPCLGLAFNDLTFVVKEGLLSYPVFGAIMRAVHPIAVTRRNPREDLKTVLHKGQEYLSGGYSIVIFPQATRSAVFDAVGFNSLGIKLARKAGVPVVPVALKTDFQGNGRIIKEMGPVDPRKTLYFKFGAPVAVEGGGQKAHQDVVEFIAKTLRGWGGEVKGF
ncbi:MAG: lysophospholipid acyltransferase family protein [Pseudomonadota bacterium]